MQRTILVGLTILLGFLTVACSGGGGSSKRVERRANIEPSAAPAAAPAPFLDAADVMAITRSAAEAIDATTMVIAVTDREGQVLALFRKPNAPANVIGNFGATVNANDFAVSLARTGAFFSNDQAPLSSRTVRFISGRHFPPGVENKPNAALYGIENTNRGCPIVLPGDPPFNPPPLAPPTSVNGLPCNALDTRGCGLGIATGKADLFDSDANAVTGGGVPIFKDGRVVGGIGVAGVAPDLAEFAAFAGSVPGAAFGPRPAAPGVITVDGVILPFVVNRTRPAGAGPGVFDPAGFVLGPIDSPRGTAGVPDGWLIGPAGSGQLTQDDVNIIISQAVAQADITRAAIRLPLGSTTRLVLAVSDLQGTILGLFRMPDSTIFSVDVAVTKARNMAFFNSAARSAADLPGVPIGTAVTNRTISFGAQPFFPPGIVGTSPGPFFQLYVNDVLTPCRQGSQPPNVRQSGIVFFPGSLPLYKNGVLVGGLGVSGDGVEQDDLVAAAGATGYAPPGGVVTADQIIIGGARLPFLKFPRNPEAI